jgi:hypothetical protein
MRPSSYTPLLIYAPPPISRSVSLTPPPTKYPSTNANTATHHHSPHSTTPPHHQVHPDLFHAVHYTHTLYTIRIHCTRYTLIYFTQRSHHKIGGESRCFLTDEIGFPFPPPTLQVQYIIHYTLYSCRYSR